MLKTLFDPASAGSGALAAIGAGACCAIPNALFAFGAAGAGSAWFEAFGWMGPYRTWLLAFAALATGAGFAMQIRSWRSECAANGVCARPLARRASFWLRGLAVVAIGGVLAYG